MFAVTAMRDLAIAAALTAVLIAALSAADGPPDARVVEFPGAVFAPQPRAPGGAGRSLPRPAGEALRPVFAGAGR